MLFKYKKYYASLAT